MLEKRLLDQSKEVKFCKRCVMSNQRPGIVFDEEGVCGACRYADEKKNVIDWKDRKRQLEELLDKHRRKDGSWDAIVSCSGGKDASFVAHQLKDKYGMHPLTVTAAPFKYTDIGFQNLQNFIDSGFANLLYHPNGKLQRKLARVAFEEVGDPFLPFIYGQMCFSFHIALKFDIKLVFYGENGNAEYGGDQKNNNKPYMPLEDQAISYWKGTAINDLIGYALEHKDYFAKEDFDKSDLIFLQPPPVEHLNKSDIQMHWYGYYTKWNPQENYHYSVKHTGFKARPLRSEGTYSKYASLDDRTDGFHYYTGLMKFGIGRATSDAAHEIRDGQITREEGVDFVRRYDTEFPGKHFKEFLEYLDITEEHFWKVLDKFRQPHLWKRDKGVWKLKHQVS